MYIYIYWGQLYICFLFEVFFCFFTIMHWSCKTKQKPQAGEFVILNWLRFNSLSPLRPNELSYCVDSVNCSTCGSHWYSSSSLVSFVCPWTRTWISKMLTHILVGEHVSHLLTSGAEGFARQCYTLVSMKHYVYPVNYVQLKSKIIWNMDWWCDLCSVLARLLVWAEFVNVVYEDKDLKLVWGSSSLSRNDQSGSCQNASQPQQRSLGGIINEKHMKIYF